MPIASSSVIYQVQTNLANAYNTLLLTQQKSSLDTYDQIGYGRESLTTGMSTNEFDYGVVLTQNMRGVEKQITSQVIPIMSPICSSLDSFFVSQYGSKFKDYFNSKTAAATVAWNNTFKRYWSTSQSEELVIKIASLSLPTGLGTGSSFSIYSGEYSTISGVTSTLSSSKTIVGTNTKFLSEVNVGDQLSFGATGITSALYTGIVDQIIDDTHLSLASALSFTGIAITTYSTYIAQSNSYLELRWGSYCTGLGTSGSITSGEIQSLAITVDRYGLGSTTITFTPTPGSSGVNAIGLSTNSNNKGYKITAATIVGIATSSRLFFEVWTKSA